MLNITAMQYFLNFNYSYISRTNTKAKLRGTFIFDGGVQLRFLPAWSKTYYIWNMSWSDGQSYAEPRHVFSSQASLFVTHFVNPEGMKG